ncbi:MAG: tetratricopeptide repeat protein [Candidatus Zixiibacteriota bacterium]
MAQNIKITKRDLKEDKFTTNMLLAKDYIMNNWVIFAGGAAVIVLIVLGITFLQQEQSRKEIAAADIYNRAASQLMGKSYPLAIVDYKLIIDEYGSSTVAEQATFELGNAYFYNKQYTEAKEAFEAYLSSYEGNNQYFTTSAMAGAAASLAALGDMAGAADMYRAAAEKYPDFDMAGQYLYDAMKHYALAENLESARVIFAKLTNDYKSSRFYRDAVRLAGEYGIEL